MFPPEERSLGSVITDQFLANNRPSSRTASNSNRSSVAVSTSTNAMSSMSVRPGMPSSDVPRMPPTVSVHTSSASAAPNNDRQEVPIFGDANSVFRPPMNGINPPRMNIGTQYAITDRNMATARQPAPVSGQRTFNYQFPPGTNDVSLSAVSQAFFNLRSYFTNEQQQHQHHHGHRAGSHASMSSRRTSNASSHNHAPNYTTHSSSSSPNHRRPLSASVFRPNTTAAPMDWMRQERSHSARAPEPYLRVHDDDGDDVDDDDDISDDQESSVSSAGGQPNRLSSRSGHANANQRSIAHEQEVHLQLDFP